MTEPEPKNDRSNSPLWRRVAWWLTVFAAGYALGFGLDQFMPGWLYDATVMVERYNSKKEQYAEFAEGNALYFQALDAVLADGVVGTQNSRLDEGLRKMREAADSGLTEANLIVGTILCTGRQGAQERNIPAGAKYLQRAHDAGNKEALSILVTRCTAR